MSMLLAIDAGQARVYGASFETTISNLCVRLLSFAPPTPERAVLLQQPGDFEPPDVVAIEKPIITPNTPNWKAVTDCAWSGALVAGAFECPVHAYEPSQWKASVCKPLHHRRIWRVMMPSERALFTAETESVINRACAHYAATGKVKNYSHDWHNWLDAVGVGLFHLGRTGRGGAKKR
jgi:hypothetical protein